MRAVRGELTIQFTSYDPDDGEIFVLGVLITWYASIGGMFQILSGLMMIRLVFFSQ